MSWDLLYVASHTIKSDSQHVNQPQYFLLSSHTTLQRKNLKKVCFLWFNEKSSGKTQVYVSPGKLSPRAVKKLQILGPQNHHMPVNI